MGKPKILFIDDEIEYINTISEYFSMIGFETIKAATGSQGISMIKEMAPNMVFCDLKLPDIDGDEVLRLLMDFDDQIPCIIVTAFRDDTVVEQLLKNGARQVMSKPLSLKEITGIVMNSLGGK